MPLELAPSFDDHTREQVEAHLEVVRLRRLVAAMDYQQGKELKLQNESNVVEGKLGREFERLGKLILKLDDTLDKIEECLAKCEMLKSEAGFATDRLRLAKE